MNSCARVESPANKPKAPFLLDFLDVSSFGGVVHSQQQPFLSVIAIDDMVYTAERFLTALHAFHRDATASSSSAVDLLKPNDVQWDLGYHYTTHENLARIRTDGLLSKTERASHDIHEVKFNGSAFGDGIYAASTPHAFRNQRYGNVGVLVVRLHVSSELSNVRYPPRAVQSALYV